MRRTFFALIVSALLVGCGDDERSVTPNDNALARAASATSQQKSAKATFNGTIEVSGQKGTTKGNGVIGFKPPAAQLDMTVAIAGKNVDTQEVLTDGVMYTKLPAEISSSQTQGKSWMKIDFDKLTKGGFSGAMNAGTDPSQYLQMLAAAGTVKKVGTENVGGRPTTHYSAEIDVKKSVEQQKGANKAFLDQSLKYIDGDTLPVDVWIDNHNLVRREEIRIKTKEVNGVPGQDQDLTMEFSDYGTSTSAIKPPPPGDTFDGTDAAAKVLNP